MKFTFIFGALAALANPVDAFNPGGKASIAFTSLQEAKNTYFDFVLNLVNQVKIPDISFHHGSMDGNSFHVTEAANNVVFNPGAGNTIDISVNSLNAAFHSHTLRYKVTFVTAKGSLDAHVSNMAVGLKLGVTTQKLPNGKTVPAVRVISSAVDLPKSHISLSIHGNIIAKFASLFKSLFMGTVRD